MKFLAACDRSTMAPAGPCWCDVPHLFLGSGTNSVTFTTFSGAIAIQFTGDLRMHDGKKHHGFPPDPVETLRQTASFFVPKSKNAV